MAARFRHGAGRRGAGTTGAWSASGGSSTSCVGSTSGRAFSRGQSRSAGGEAPALTLVGTGGWARRCLDAGAGAFVGAYWSVSDQAACGFAQAFYREVRAGKSLGAAMRAARAAIRTPDDPTWLAYTVFGDPAAVVEPAKVSETLGG